MKIKCFPFLAVLLFASVNAWAQPQKGSVMIGGNAGFTSTKYPGFIEDFTVTSITVAPMAAFFVSDQFAVGGSINLTILGGDADGSSIAASPLARYYFNNSGSSRFFGQAAVSFGSIDPGEGADSQSFFGYGVLAGVDFFLNSNVAIEAGLGFNSQKAKDDNDPTNTFGLVVGVAAFIGGGSE